MAVDANIFQQYLQQPKSVMDYTAELDQADARKNALQQSAFAVRKGESDMQAAAESGRRRNALLAMVQGGQIDLSNPDHFNRAMSVAPDAAPALMEAVQKSRGAAAQATKETAHAGLYGAQTASEEQKLKIEKNDRAIKDIAAFQSPQEARASLQRHAQAGDIDFATANSIVANMPQDDAGFAQWQVRMLRGLMTAKDQIALSVPDAGAVLSSETARRGQDITAETTRQGQRMTDARGREKNQIVRESIGKVDWKMDPDGNWIALPKEIKAGGPVTPVTTTAPGKRAIQAGHALDIIEEARGLIDQGTSSYLGAGVDQAARVFGRSTQGAEAAAKLKALEGALMMAQPRMEGPQSDRDVALYRQMAGQIGDPTVPAQTKQAAISAIENLHKKYAATVPARSPAESPAQAGRILNFSDLPK